MSVLSHLEYTASRAVLSASELASINRSISHLSKLLTAHFGASITSQVQFGSSTRGTILPRDMDPQSDIDYLIVYANPNLKPQTLLNSLKVFVTKYYSRSEIRQSSPTIILELSHIKFELVPAIRDFYGLKIPAPNRHYEDWMVTDPSAFNIRLESVNGQNRYKLKPMLRLLKYWNAQAGFPYESYSLEVWATELDFWICNNLRDFFYKAIESLSFSHHDPQRVKNVVTRAQQGVQLARSYESNGYASSAETEIRKLVP